MTTAPEPAPRSRRWLHALLGFLWAALGLSSLLFWWFSDLRLQEVPTLLSDWLTAVGLARALALVVVLYAVRPLLLFPSSVMGVVSGITFGPLLGMAVVTGGELLGSAVAFSLTRLLGRSWVDANASDRLARLDRRISRNGLLTVCLLRLVMLPFDTVSYACGLTGVRLRDFLLGTLLGGASYYLGVSLLGASASADLSGEVTLAGLELPLRWLVLGLSLASFAVGVALALVFRGRYRAADPVGA